MRVLRGGLTPGCRYNSLSRRSVTFPILANLHRGKLHLVPPMQEQKPDDSMTEAVLIQRILAGERDLFHDLIRPYERRCFLQAYSILRNQDDAEETV